MYHDHAHLYVRQSHNPCSKLSGEAQGVQHYEGRVSKPVQDWGAHPRDAERVEWVSGAGKKGRGGQRIQEDSARSEEVVARE